MELLPTLRAQLDELEPHLDDPEVAEILVAGPDRVFVTRAGRSERVEIALPERRVRALADRLLRALGGRPDRHEVRSGRLSDALEISVIGTPRGARCPVVRVERRPAPGGALSELTQAGLLSAEIEAALVAQVKARRTLTICAPFAAPRHRLLRAIAGLWHDDARVVALDGPDGALADAEPADLVFPAGTPASSLLAAAPDVIVTLDPPAATWTALLEAGRPTLCAVEAPDGPAGLERLVALALAGDARLSRAAAEALVLSSVGAVLELAPGRRFWLRRLMQPDLQDGRLVAAPTLEQPAPAVEATPAPAVDEAPSADESTGTETAHDTSAFAAAALVEELSNEIAEAEAALRDKEPEAPVVQTEAAQLEPEAKTRFATHPPPKLDPLEDRAVSATIEVEEHTRFAGPEQTAALAQTLPDPPREPSRPKPAARTEPETSPLPPRRRVPSERMATVTGPPRPSEVRRQIADVLDEIDVGDVSSTELDQADIAAAAEALEEFGEDLRTSNAVAPPNLDPFETQEASLVPSLMDSTQAAEISEMLSGEVTADPRVLSVPAEATRARPAAEPPSADEWDEDAPSEIIDRANVAPAAAAPEPADSPFDDEKTPVAPLFDKSKQPRATRRPRRAPRANPDGARPSAADDLGDPIRRADATPERPRGGRRRQRDRS